MLSIYWHKKGALMHIKQLLCLTLITIIVNSYCMDKENHFKKLPKELLPTILIQKDNQYPWRNFINAWKLKNVCKEWQEAIGRAKKLAKALSIPAMHCAAMMNRPNEIIKLKLGGHSPLAPDMHRLMPMNYAFACRQPHALIMLRIGFATMPIETGSTLSPLVCDSYTEVRAHKDYAQILKIIQARPSDKYTDQNFIDAIIANHYKRMVRMLSANSKTCSQEIYNKAKSLNRRRITRLLLYAIQCNMETALFSHIHLQKNLDKQFFENFIQCNANPNAYDVFGRTFLHCIALKQSSQPITQKLLQLKNININLPSLLKGESAIQHCAYTGNTELLTLLLETKKLKNEQLSDVDHAALNYAVSNNQIDCLNILIQYGADINRIDTLNGYASLHYAAHYGNGTAINTLIQNGADKNLKTKWGRTALHLARENNHQEAIKLLS